MESLNYDESSYNNDDDNEYNFVRDKFYINLLKYQHDHNALPDVVDIKIENFNNNAYLKTIVSDLCKKVDKKKSHLTNGDNVNLNNFQETNYFELYNSISETLNGLTFDANSSTGTIKMTSQSDTRNSDEINIQESRITGSLVSEVVRELTNHYLTGKMLKKKKEEIETLVLKNSNSLNSDETEAFFIVLSYILKSCSNLKILYLYWFYDTQNNRSLEFLFCSFGSNMGFPNLQRLILNNLEINDSNFELLITAFEKKSLRCLKYFNCDYNKIDKKAESMVKILIVRKNFPMLEYVSFIQNKINDKTIDNIIYIMVEAHDKNESIFTLEINHSKKFDKLKKKEEQMKESKKRDNKKKAIKKK